MFSRVLIRLLLNASSSLLTLYNHDDEVSIRSVSDKNFTHLICVGETLQELAYQPCIPPY